MVVPDPNWPLEEMLPRAQDRLLQAQVEDKDLQGEGVYLIQTFITTAAELVLQANQEAMAQEAAMQPPPQDAAAGIPGPDPVPGAPMEGIQ